MIDAPAIEKYLPFEGKEFPMRRWISTGLALIGMALAVPAAATAGSPDMRHGLFKGAKSQKKHVHQHVHNHDAPSGGCSTCESPEAVVVTNGTLTAPGACTACQAAAMQQVEAPGLASLRPSEAPGFASMNGRDQVLSSEPTPIGVVQAGFRPEATGMPTASSLFHQSAGQPQGANLGPIAPTMGGMPGKPHARPHIIRHLLGLDGFGRMGQEREAREASKHAQTTFGTNDQRVVDVPANMVYGR
jgi:hypothetical protein